MREQSRLANWLLNERYEDYLMEASVPEVFLAELKKINIDGWKLEYDNSDDNSKTYIKTYYIPRKLTESSLYLEVAIILKQYEVDYKIGFLDESNKYTSVFLNNFSSFDDLGKYLNSKSKELQAEYLKLKDGK